MPNLTLLQNFQNPADNRDVVHFQLLLVESNDGLAGNVTYHHGTVEPWDDLDGVVDETVRLINTGLESLTLVDGRQMSYPPISEQAVLRIKGWCKNRWTSEVLTRWNARREQIRIDYEADQLEQKQAVEAAQLQEAARKAAEEVAFNERVAEAVAKLANKE